MMANHSVTQIEWRSKVTVIEVGVFVITIENNNLNVWPIPKRYVIEIFVVKIITCISRVSKTVNVVIVINQVNKGKRNDSPFIVIVSFGLIENQIILELKVMTDIWKKHQTTIPTLSVLFVLVKVSIVFPKIISLIKLVTIQIFVEVLSRNDTIIREVI